MTKLYAWTELRFVKCSACGLPEECIWIGEDVFDAKALCRECFHKEAVKHKHQIECVDAFCATCKFRQYKNSNCTTCFATGVETGDFIHYEPSEAQRLHNSNVKLITSAQELQEENKRLKHQLQVERERADEHVADCKAAEKRAEDAAKLLGCSVGGYCNNCQIHEDTFVSECCDKTEARMHDLIILKAAGAGND